MALPTPTTWPQSVCFSGLKKDSGAKPCNLAIHGATSRESAIPLPLHIPLNTMQDRLQICCQVCEEEVCLASSESTPSIYASAYCEGCPLFWWYKLQEQKDYAQSTRFIHHIHRPGEGKSASATLDSSLLIFARSLRKQFLALAKTPPIGLRWEKPSALLKNIKLLSRCKNRCIYI